MKSSAGRVLCLKDWQGASSEGYRLVDHGLAVILSGVLKNPSESGSLGLRGQK